MTDQPTTSYLQVQTTFPGEQEARQVATTLLAERLAACVQCLGPLHSMYHWQGQVEASSEWLCLLKTSTAHWPRLQRRLTELHSYECPELIALPIVAVSDSYAAWMQAELAPLPLPE